ncbi:TIGR04255 family protein [Sinirhodobacter huangdaonensis]|uniref:TIGR04255 family protein n=1 Tax=Paenirhodobacter huangdaonensis TaxID=2501515 RepID=A0A443LVW6_9RHOB|nr:TIGR04255 family protein [Sinirhodobacter huangdaonensis]RWR53341.1 TIGR04255 family protein [Sinirhodobacter huangdaonensis]
MGWKPIHEAHAIDRVRILVQFNSPLTDKILTKAAAPATSKFQELGFEQLHRAESTIQGFMIAIPPGPIAPEIAQNGWVLKRGSAGVLTEEAGFRDGVFGYLSTEYGRWDNLATRFWDVFEVPLSIALDSTDISSIKLEYWDRFVFDGEPTSADIRDLLATVDPVIPKSAVSGAMLWHSHSGWFEDHNGSIVLVNRNIDVIDEASSAGPRRQCNIFTLVELRATQAIDSVHTCKSTLDHLHRRSLALFGASLTEEQRNNIGLNILDYLQ